jgi:hypothetical protein
MRWWLDAGNGTFGVPKPPSPFDTPRGVWTHALARAATLPDVIFEVLRSKLRLVPSEDAGGKEATKDTGNPTKRKRGEGTNMP